ncbi:hypothetical protein BaRGS_00031408 [Batillaria attramentaria]|uniref:Uncharacterized protein n=1 Tax=Batillaria attramentaria TaxID=370345 RepID=A0ABD0JRY4_9CAEN
MSILCIGGKNGIMLCGRSGTSERVHSFTQQRSNDVNKERPGAKHFHPEVLVSHVGTVSKMAAVSIPLVHLLPKQIWQWTERPQE